MKKFINDLIAITVMSCLIMMAYSAGVWSYKELKSDSFFLSLDGQGESSVGTFSYRPPVIPSYLTKITAYCPCEICCGSHADGITASGLKATVGMVAAPKGIPFGTVLNIDGVEYVVADRGGAITSTKFIHEGQTVYGCLDIFFPTHQNALNWGVQYLMVYEVK